MANGSAADRQQIDQVSHTQVRAELGHILGSPQFSGSERLSNFFQFVVDKTLAGESEDIKEYLIATEVYRRGAAYDPKTDSIVRVEASRLRRKLQDYYLAGGHPGAVHFDLPKGSYVPTFTIRPMEPPAPPPLPVNLEIAPVIVPASAAPPAIPHPTRLAKPAAVALVLLLLAGGVWWFRHQSGERPQGPRLLPVTSLAVLPLVNLSPNPQDATLADGLTEAITNALSQTSKLRVTGRTSAYRYKGKPDTVPRIGAELGVGSILEGSVQREGGRLRVMVQLVGTADGFHLWSQSFEQPFHDSLTAEKEVAQAVGRVVADQLLAYAKNGAAPGATTTAEALRLYQKGEALLNTGATDHLLLPDSQQVQPAGSMARLLECIDLFNRAIAIDPKYARAYAGLAVAYYVASDYDASLVPKVQAAAEHALQLDANLPEAYEVLGYLRFLHQWDFTGAENAFRRSIELNPRNVTSRRLYADVAMVLGHPQQAAAQLRTAQETYPASPVIQTELAIVSYNMRDYSRMAQQAAAINKAFPNLPVGHWTLGLAYEQQGKLKEAEAEFENCLLLSPRNPRCTPALGHVLGKLGRRDEARKIVESYKQRPQTEFRSPYSIALIALGLGEKETALEWLERAFDQHDSSLPYARIDPRFDPLTREPRFAALMTKLHLPVAPGAVSSQK